MTEQEIEVRASAVMLGWRTAATVVVALVVGSVTGTATVLRELARIEAGLAACATVPETLSELNERVTALEIAVAGMR